MNCTIEGLNDEALLGDTPIGRLAVVNWCGEPHVAVMFDEEPSRIKRVIHRLRPNQNPLDAIYGKCTFEKKSVLRQYNKAVDARVSREQRRQEDLRKDTRIDVQKQLEKSWDGTVDELIRRALGMRGRS